jgi:hypothetical protein
VAVAGHNVHVGVAACQAQQLRVHSVAAHVEIESNV